MNIKTRSTINRLKTDLLKHWYISVKPIAKLLLWLDDVKYKHLKNRKWNEKKIKKELNKQIQKLILHNKGQIKYHKSLYLIDRYIYDIQREFNGMYNVEYLFHSNWKLLKNEYLHKYFYYGSKSTQQEFIDKWLPIIIDIFEENNLNIVKVDKDDICPDNKYWKYDDIYKKLNNVWKVEM